MTECSKIDRYLVDSIQEKADACRVIVDYQMEPNTMRVPPDVFAKIKQFSDDVEHEIMIRENFGFYQEVLDEDHLP